MKILKKQIKGYFQHKITAKIKNNIKYIQILK